MNEQEKKQIISRHFSEISKKGHATNPRSKEFYQEIQKKSVAARKKNNENT